MGSWRALIVAVSAAICLGLIVAASWHSTLLLGVLFCGWVILPFAGLAFVGGRGSPRSGLDPAIVAVSLVSVAFYTLNAIHPMATARALPYLVAPVVAWVAVGVLSAWNRAARSR
jgi:hypothetical protein